MAVLTSIVIPVLTLVTIFLFGLQKFSKQIQRVAGNGFRGTLEKLTKTPLRGVGIGALFTALIQSSTATTVILISLIDAGLISFSNSLGVIIGANIGSTVTSQLVALKLTSIAPLFVLLGFAMTYFGGRYKHLGKPIFYFGLIFFCLSLISLYIEPLRSDPGIIQWFSSINNIFTAILVGMIFTAIVQSSGVTSALVIILVGSGLLNIYQAVGVMLGANIGTTVTALIASLGMNANAKKAAIAHFIFNICGVLIFLPFIDQFTGFVSTLGGSTQQVVANAHLIFNLTCALIFLVFLKVYEGLINKITY